MENGDRTPVPRVRSISALLRFGRNMGLTYVATSNGSAGDGTKMNPLGRGQGRDKGDRTPVADEVTTGVCSIADSPYRILRLAALGKYDEFVRMYHADPKRLAFRDKQGAGALHHAASRNRINIMEFILEQNEDINVTDAAGNTPLHVAVEHDHPEAVDFLLNNGAGSTRLNNHNMAAIHLAADRNKTKALEALVKRRDIDVNYQGDLGQTALHFGAIKDNTEAVKILLRTPAINPCVRDSNEVYAIHAAAKHGSAGVLDLLIAFYKESCISRKALAYIDKEGNTALHSAVNSGDFAAVKLCLKYGARIDVQQVIKCKGERATPLHLACTQGSLDIVKLMLSTGQTDKDTALNVPDCQLQLPLHRAAMFDHAEIVDYLLQEGSYIDAQDKNQRTPLLLATQRGSWRSVLLLLERGADVTVTDCEDRNVLHLIVLHGGSLEILGREFFKKPEAAILLNHADSTGCTPMHYATREGCIKVVQGLIEMGATVNLKNKDKQSPLHFAARYGRFNTCKQLLDSPIGPNIINETDSEGMTALHIASWFGHYRVVKLLMFKGALLHKDHNGRSPMHLAAMEDYTNTVDVLHTVHCHLINWKDDDENTALHLAAIEGKVNAVVFLLNHGAEIKRNKKNQTVMDVTIESQNKDVALAITAHERWHEVMMQSSDTRPHMLGLVAHMPEVALSVLDRCEEVIDNGLRHCKGYSYDFRYLQCSAQSQQNFSDEKTAYVPLLVLNTMVKFNRIKLLSHPVCVTFLSMKWKAYGRTYHMLNILLYLFFLAFLTLLIWHKVPLQLSKSIHANLSCEATSAGHQEIPLIHEVSKWTLAVYAGLSILKEVGQLVHQRHKYFLEANNAIECVLYISTLLYVCPFFVDIPRCNLSWQTPFGAIAVFLAWFNLLLYLQRFDIFGIYVVMFLEILRTLVQVLFVFSILFIAFGLAFFMLLSQEASKAHATPIMSMLRVCTALMLGELDYINSFVEPSLDYDPITMPHPEITFIFLFACVLLLPVLLMNLLIGLAVGDIAEVQYNARLKRLAMQVELHTELEHKLPKRILKYGEKDHLTVRPPCKKKFLTRLWLKIMESAGMEEGMPKERLRTAADVHINVVHGELMKQKRRMKEITSQLDKQYNLLRLIVQKMEIRSEADDMDEGEHPSGRRGSTMAQIVRQTMSRNRFCSRRYRGFEMTSTQGKDAEGPYKETVQGN
ncbi:transient receptor potential cation channel subfamily A member 1-like [Acanthaster planci]|uniref:Transient receptor potential cation channel subfamily A member 1-like n=1 Tax=Acanthaster planci TaxID=133434 RepID=A0A8B7YPL6_ACAPL|nr:transient receptor potential cation channel subfamily A member 1-like [Acanthaster planci]